MGKIEALMLGWSKTEEGYRRVDVEGILLDAGKDGIPDAVLDSLTGQMVVAYYQTEWRPKKGGGWFPRRRLLAIRKAED
ncbi:MAG: hypothetical protein QXQ53_07605 [Candidatus Methanosuratincola sp.]